MGKAIKYISGGILFLGGIMALFLFGIRSCLSQYDERSALAPVVYVEKGGKAVLVSIVQYQQTNSYSQKGGMTQRSVTDEFYIQNNDAITGEKISAKQIKYDSDKRQHPMEILGLSGNNVWIFVNELIAYDAFTLEKTAGVGMIEDKNPALKGRLPLERKYYEFIPATSSIKFIAKDGSPWMIDTKTLIATAEEEEKVVATTSVQDKINEAQAIIKEMNKTNIHFSEIKLNQDTMNGKWFGIYSPEEFSTLTERVTIGVLHGENKRRQLITSVYDSVSDYQRFVLNKIKAQAIPSAGYFLEGGFLINKKTAGAFHFSDPASTLVVYKDQVGNDGKIIVSRVSTEGKVLWKYETGLSQWIDWQCIGNRLYVYGCNRKELSSMQCNLLLIIDLNNGSVKAYDYFKDKMSE